MCGTEDSLMLSQYVCYSRQFKSHKICVMQQTVYCLHNMCGTEDSLKCGDTQAYQRPFLGSSWAPTQIYVRGPS